MKKVKEGFLTNETLSSLFRDHEFFLGHIGIGESFDVII
jgi:hypothetical protein